MRDFLNFKVLTLLMVLILAACGNGDDAAETDEQADGDIETSDIEQELVFATASDPVGLSPVETWDTISDLSINQMYERLFERDAESGEIVPLLATGYENPDDRTWTISLQEGVEFHDGTPFNAEAVKYTFEKLVDPEVAAPGAHIMSFMESIEVVDEYTVELVTHEPNPNVLPVLTNRTTAIISPEADQNQNLMQDPVGTGPFKFESWTQGDRLIMTKNENYWGEAPQLEKITFVTVPDAQTAISMLEAGEVQMVDGIEAESIPRLEAMDGVELLQTEGTGVFFFSFNMDKEPMNEPEFRQAVAMALDIEGYISQLDGVGFSSHSLFGPAVLDYDESIEDSGIEYNLEEAKNIIAENNYGDQELTIYTSDRSTYRRMAEIAQAQLTDAGLNVKIEMMEWGTMLDSTSEGNHDMFVLGSSNSMNGLETLYGYFHSDSLGANNRTQHSDPAFDEVIDEARRTLDDDARQALINESHEKVVEEALMVPMHHAVNTLALHESLDGVELPPEIVFSLKNAYRK